MVVTLQELERMDPYEFEHLVAQVWESKGYDTEVSLQSQDRGVDIIAEKAGWKEAIQVKRYGSGNKIGSKTIREYATLYQQIPTANKVVLVTTSTFTQEGERLADDLNVESINGSEIVDAINDVEGLEIEDTSSNSEVDQHDQDAVVEEYLSQISVKPWNSPKPRVKCPFCTKQIAAERESFLDHWKNNSDCDSDLQIEYYR